MTAKKTKPSALAKARAILQPSPAELKRAFTLVAKINGAKGGKSRSKKKTDAVRASIKKAQAKRWGKK